MPFLLKLQDLRPTLYDRPGSEVPWGWVETALRSLLFNGRERFAVASPMPQISKDFPFSLLSIKSPIATESVLGYSGTLRPNAGNIRSVLQTSIIMFFNGSLVVSIELAIPESRSKKTAHILIKESSPN
jgi:hypothetical protein